jgi:hypothetical protein
MADAPPAPVRTIADALMQPGSMMPGKRCANGMLPCSNAKKAAANNAKPWIRAAFTSTPKGFRCNSCSLYSSGTNTDVCPYLLSDAARNNKDKEVQVSLKVLDAMDVVKEGAAKRRKAVPVAEQYSVVGFAQPASMQILVHNDKAVSEEYLHPLLVLLPAITGVYGNYMHYYNNTVTLPSHTRPELPFTLPFTVYGRYGTSYGGKNWKTL